MFKSFGRTIVLAVLASCVAIFFTIAIVSSDTSQPKAQASDVQSVQPAPGAILRPQEQINVDLNDSFTGRIEIDGTPIPDDELERVASLGQFSFRPGKNKTFEKFESGTHSAKITYWPADKSEPENPQTYTWQFKVSA
ncbi:MAG: hypothetical protein U0R17_06605 [Acidimicrobiia bacterium]